MGLVRTALIFGAGYVLGRPEGRAKLAELGRRPEVTQLKQQAASTVSSGVQAGKQQLSKATGKANGGTSTSPSTTSIGTSTGTTTGTAVGRAATGAASASPADTTTGRTTGGTTTGGTFAAQGPSDRVSGGTSSTGVSGLGTSSTGTSGLGTSGTGTSGLGTSSVTGSGLTSPRHSDDQDRLREKAREHISDLPGETALGKADPQGPRSESPKEWEAKHPKPTD